MYPVESEPLQSQPHPVDCRAGIDTFIYSRATTLVIVLLFHFKVEIFTVSLRRLHYT